MGRELKFDLAAELWTVSVAAELCVCFCQAVSCAQQLKLRSKAATWRNEYEVLNYGGNRTQCTPRSMCSPSFLPSEPLLADICTDQLDHGHPTAAACAVTCMQNNMQSNGIEHTGFVPCYCSIWVILEATMAWLPWAVTSECRSHDVLQQRCAIVGLKHSAAEQQSRHKWMCTAGT